MINISYKDCCRRCNNLDVEHEQIGRISGELLTRIGCNHMAVCAAYNKKDTLTYTDEDGIHVISQGGCCRNCGYWQELNHECLKIGNPNYSRHTDSEYKCEDYRYFEE